MAATLTTSDFIQKFHSITGTTIGERRRNLFLLLVKASENHQAIDFKQLQPKTPLEENFKLEALIYFNNAQELLSALTCENPILIQKIVKKASPILVQTLCGVMDEQLLNILSNISLNAKLKLLNKCGQCLDDTRKAESFFNAIYNKYGVYLATKLLTACSIEFIVDFLEKTGSKLTSQQLLMIVKKHPEIASRLFEILHKHFNVVQEYTNVFKYLSRNNLPLFISLHKIYNFDRLNIGRRATNNFIKHYKSNIISNSKMYSDILQMKYVRKSLHGEDFNLFYFGLFPPLITQFEKSFEQILTLTPTLDILLLGFRRAYNTELWTEPKLITPKVLEMMTNDERLKLLKPEYKPSDFTDDDWVCFLNTFDAIALLKKRIFLTSDIKSRAKLISLLVETCRINKDKAALLEICNYMIKQHRNDHISVRLSFLRAVRKDFKLKNLEMAHWSVINEIIQIFQLNGEEFFHIEDFMIDYIEYCIKNEQPIKDTLLACLKRRTFWGSWNLFSEKPAYEKICLQIVPEILPDFESDLINNSLAYINALLSWNKRHPKDTFPVFDNLNYREHLKNALKRTDGHLVRYQDTMMWCILKNKLISDRYALLELSIPNMDLHKINWICRYDIDFLLNNFNACITASLNSNIPIDSVWLYCKLYSHLDLPKKIVDISLQTLSQELSEDEKQIKRNSCIALSYLMPASDLLVLKYKVGPYLKNSVLDSNLIETIIKNCNTNGLPSVKRTLFSLMNNLSESNLLHIILQLIQIKNIHVRKVALYMLFRTMEKQTVMDVLKRFVEDPRNATLNKFILSKAFKYFTKNPEEYIWNIIQLCVKTVDVDDEEAYSLVLQPYNVPDTYLARYIVFMWSTVEKVPNFYKDYGIVLLQFARVNLLPHEFCEALIEKYFFCYVKNYSCFYITLHAFVSKYICYNPAIIEKCAAKILQAPYTSKDLQLRSYVNHFIRQFCYECMNQNKKDVLVRFSEQWDKFTKPYEMFEEYLQIRFSLIKLENLKIPEIASHISNLCIDLTDKYGIDVLHQYSCEIKPFSEKYFINGITDREIEINRFSLVENIVKTNNLILILLGILLLENHQPSLVPTKRKYDKLIENFRMRPELEVRIYLNDLLKV